jgi:hypothetical protein
MNLEVLRYSSQKDSTNGLLFEVSNDKRDFLCYTLEDEERDVKIMGETRIPNGEYEIKLRTEGGFHNKYVKRFEDIHIGMLHITNVPNFEYVLIHCGNTDEHTAGCLLVGDSQENNSLLENGWIGKSSQAYARVYLKIAQRLEKGEKVFINYKSI